MQINESFATNTSCATKISHANVSTLSTPSIIVIYLFVNKLNQNKTKGRGHTNMIKNGMNREKEIVVISENTGIWERRGNRRGIRSNVLHPLTTSNTFLVL